MSRISDFEAGQAAREASGKSVWLDPAAGEEDIMAGDNKAGVTAVRVTGAPRSGYQDVRAYRGKENVGVLQIRDSTAEHIFVPVEDRRMGIGSMLGRVANFKAGRAGADPIKISSDRSKDGDAWAKTMFDEKDIPTRKPHFVHTRDLKDIE